MSDNTFKVVALKIGVGTKAGVKYRIDKWNRENPDDQIVIDHNENTVCSNGYRTISDDSVKKLASMASGRW